MNVENNERSYVFIYAILVKMLSIDDVVVVKKELYSNSPILTIVL
jgi:hypothetical protein